ncbi:hypothetical protein ACP70R_030347 [Stipagrostis hirtigluma subsp. patula]
MGEANGGGEAADAMELTTVGNGTNATSGEEVTVRIDMAVLHCPLCFLPLKPPIFQCEVGHLACGACRALLPGSRCRACVHGGGAYGRCPGLDAFFRAVKIQCPYDAYGCASYVPYCDAGDHQRVCPCAPCSCPESGCAFLGPPPKLLDHISGEHCRPATLIRYGQEWSLTLPLSQRWHVLVVEHQERPAVFLVSLGELGAGAGAAVGVSLVCVRANGGRAALPQYMCRLGLQLPCGGDSDGEDAGAVVMEWKVRSSALPGGAPAPDDGVFVGARPQLLSGETLTLSVRIDEIPPATGAAAAAVAATTTVTRSRSSKKLH